MSYAKRMVQLPTSRMRHVVVLSITAAVAFTLGVATGPIGRAVLPTTAPGQTSRAAIVAPVAAVTELYDGGWAGGPGPGAMLRSEPAVTELYDGGWAGGPGPGAVLRSEPAARGVGLAATELYDGGWAGGPGPQSAASNGSAVSHVPYDAGWELYDGGWAGGPKTLGASSNGWTGVPATNNTCSRHTQATWASTSLVCTAVEVGCSPPITLLKAVTSQPSRRPLLA